MGSPTLAAANLGWPGCFSGMDTRCLCRTAGRMVYGLLESDDVHRWVSWLIDNWQTGDHRHPRHVFGIGESLGGAIFIQSLAVESRFSAIVADSAFSSFERIGRDRVAERLRFSPKIGRLL